MEQRPRAELHGEHPAHQRQPHQHGQCQRQGQAQVFANQQFTTRDGQRQQQIQRAAFTFAHDGVEAKQQRDQRHQIDHQAHQTGDGELDGADAHRALLRTAGVGNDDGEHGKHEGNSEHPAVAQAVAEFLGRNGGNLSQFHHASLPVAAVCRTGACDLPKNMSSSEGSLTWMSCTAPFQAMTCCSSGSLLARGTLNCRPLA